MLISGGIPSDYAVKREEYIIVFEVAFVAQPMCTPSLFVYIMSIMSTLHEK